MAYIKKTSRCHSYHGLTGTRVYKTWESMKARCYNPNDSKYQQYGGRGITVCDEWKDDAGAFAKWAYENGFDENKHQVEQSIDRINVNGNYCPENCRFVDARTQANNKTDNVLVTFKGVTDTISNWSKRTGVTEASIRYRLNHGWTVEEALTPQRRKSEYKGNTKIIDYNGAKKSVAEWARELNVPYNLFRKRIANGWTVEEAAGLKERQYEYKGIVRMVTYNGKTQSVKEWSREYNIPYKRLHKRISNGWSMERALNK